MKILRAKSAGFCMGVSLALQKLDSQILANAETARVIKTLGPIIHNPQVLEAYQQKGVQILEDPKDAKSSDLLLIRAHGIPVSIEEDLRKLGLNLIDATCPKVKKAQLAILEATNKNGVLLLFGEACHPEVLGLLSYAAANAKVFGSKQELLSFLDSSEFSMGLNYFFAAQTTQDQSLFEEMGRILQEKIGKNIPILETICDATRSRQAETLDIAKQAGLMLVLGGKNSANTRRLAMVSESAGTKAYHIETADELFLNEKLLTELQNVAIIGLTAGASTPRNLVDELQKRIESIIIKKQPEYSEVNFQKAEA